jgi:hypothetical protein
MEGLCLAGESVMENSVEIPYKVKESLLSSKESLKKKIKVKNRTTVIQQSVPLLCKYSNEPKSDFKEIFSHSS